MEGESIQLIGLQQAGTRKWAQGVSLPGIIFKKIRKLAYRFIWYGKKGISWSQMILPMEEGPRGETVRDLPVISRVSNVRSVSKFQDNSNGSLPTYWMKKRYIRNKQLCLIAYPQNPPQTQYFGKPSCLQKRTCSSAWKVGPIIE